MELTTWGHIENGIEVLDFKPHETDKKRGINLMIKSSQYYLSRIIPYIKKAKHSNFRLDNISYEEEAILFYLGLHTKCNTRDFTNEINESGLDVRTWIEKTVSTKASLTNTLFTLDYKKLTPKINSKNIPLTHNNSYSRPEILEFDEKIYNTFKSNSKQLVIIPCTQGKPYHKRKPKIDSSFTKISGNGKHLLHSYINDESYDKIVLTSLGLIPQDNWLDDTVMKYDTGTRDLWKLLCLCKRFFLKYKYEKYIVLVKFKPYRDIIRNLIDMDVIDKDKVEFIGEDEKHNGLRIMFYPKEYNLY
jgi:hypothetical protein